MKNSALLLIITLTLWTCKSAQNSKAESISSPSFEETTYQDQWKNVKRLEQKGAFKSAQVVCDSILQQAISNKNPNQLFKALAHRSKYIHLIEEDAEEKIIGDFEAQIKTAEQPAKALLHSACGELYRQYHDRNQWKRNNRSDVSADISASLAYWSLEKIMQFAAKHHLKAIEQAELIESYPTQRFETILQEAPEQTTYLFYNKKALPTLYELLAKRSLAFFKYHCSRKTRPIGFQKVADSILFSPLDHFLKKELSQQDQKAIDFQTLKLYQKVLQQLDQNKRLDALLHFELDRLEWAKQESEKDKKQELFREALGQLEKSRDWSSEQVSLIKLALAESYQSSSSLIKSRTKEDRESNYLSQALAITQEFQNDSSYAGQRLKQLQATILQTDFSITSENTYPKGQAALFFMNYRNLDSLNLKLYRIPQDLELNHRQEREMALALWRKNPLRNWSVELKNPKDYRYHNTEFYTKGLEAGRYLLLASSQVNNAEEVDDLAAVLFNVSNLSLHSLSLTKKGETYLRVHDRISGKPLKKVKIALIKRVYQASTRHYKRQVVSNYFTNSKGELTLNQIEADHYQFRLSLGNDSLTINRGLYLSSHQPKEKVRKRSQIFTDRAVYKAGQIVKLKGIVMNQNDVVANEKVEVKLLDANNKELGKKALTTNDYGSYYTQFVIPKGKLNGTFKVVDNFGQKSIEVAAYKRPTFQLKLNPPAKEVKLGDSISINGSVKSYSGFGLPELKVRYRIVEKITYPYWPFFRSYMPEQKETIIAQGVVLSGEGGDFEVSFKTSSKKDAARNWSSVKQYTVAVEAVNQAGETQQTEELIRLSDQALFMSTNLGGWISQQQLKELVVTTKNINGKAIKSDLELTLYQLQNKHDGGIKRYWADPEFSSISKKEYQKYFPQYERKAELELNELKRGEPLLSGQINSNQKVKLFNQIKVGAYELSLKTTDRFGKEISYTQRFVLYDPASKTAAFPSFLKITPLQDEVNAGEQTSFSLSTAFDSLAVHYQVEQEGALIKSGLVWLNKEQKLLKLELQASKEPYYVYFQTIRHNRFLQQKESVRVKKVMEKLSLELIQFQSKTEPGKTENWALKLRNQEGEAVEAEVLLSMYDQSLDVFAPNKWRISKSTAKQSSVSVRSFTFHQQNGQNIIRRRLHNAFPQEIFPRINWFGLRLGNSFYGRNALPMAAKSFGNESSNIMLSEASAELDGSINEQESVSAKLEQEKKPKLRSDFAETAFFFPQLKTTSKGELSFEFTMPDALTTWRFQAFAHKKDFKFAQIDTLVISQKPLMLVSNAPRFFRTADKQSFKTSVQNNTDSLQEVRLRLSFFDGLTGRPLSIFGNAYQDQTVVVEPMKSKGVSWAIEIPTNLQLLSYELTARSDKYGDRERKTAVVLNNKTLVTERESFTLNQKGISQFTFQPLAEKWSADKASQTLTFEYSANPRWYVLQALPYLAEPRALRTEKLFYKVFATAVAKKLVEQNPSLKATIRQWSQAETEVSNPLLKNPELKEALIESTPWESLAKQNSQQANSLLTLIESNQQAYALNNSLEKLAALQKENGAWPWIKGMRGNRYITQEIVLGIGQLMQIGAVSIEDQIIKRMLERALPYLTNQIELDYQNLIKRKSSINDNHLSRNQIQYLYLRSLLSPFYDFEKSKGYQYYLNQAELYWLNRPIMLQAMQALALNKLKPYSNTANEILASLKEQAIKDGRGGLYWKQIRKSNYWQEAPIESHALLIEAFSQIMPHNSADLAQMKTWLISQKRVQHWESSKATAYACHALLKSYEENDQVASPVFIKIGKEIINTQTPKSPAAYIKKTWKRSEVKPSLATIKIDKSDKQSSWGAIYWQYFEELDKVKASNQATMSVKKSIYKLVKDTKGVHLKPMEEAELKVGDLLTIRLEVNNTLDLEFVHLKDEFAACTEPVEQLSGYSRIEGLAYYRHVQNTSNNLFFERLPRGKYVFEYQLRLSQSGEFHGGISKISSQYAPEFGAHSKSGRLNIKPQSQ